MLICRNPPTISNYNIHTIKSKSKKRIIEEPEAVLKEIQKNLIFLYRKFPLHSSCKSTYGLSNVDNAIPHLDSNVLFKTDIKSFFPSTTKDKIIYAIDNSNLDNNTAADLKASLYLCLLEDRLPTGAPTSPILSNIAATPLDNILYKIATSFNFTYTRYVDDLTFSIKSNPNLLLEKEVILAINFFGYKINQKKTKWIYPNRNNSYQVTGISINGNEESLPRRLKRIIRAAINNEAKVNNKLKDCSANLQGLLSYCYMVDKSLYNKYIELFDKRVQFYKEL